MRFHDHFTPQELDILRQRAERLATQKTASRHVEHSALRVALGREYYALPIPLLTSVYEGVSIIPVPCTPAHIAGVANVRGHILSVLRLSALLGVTSEDDQSHLIVAAHQDALMGVLVSRIGDLITYTEEDITLLTGEPHRWIQGVFMDGTTLLDLTALLADPMLIVRDTPAP